MRYHSLIHTVVLYFVLTLPHLVTFGRELTMRVAKTKSLPSCSSFLLLSTGHPLTCLAYTTIPIDIHLTHLLSIADHHLRQSALCAQSTVDVSQRIVSSNTYDVFSDTAVPRSRRSLLRTYISNSIPGGSSSIHLRGSFDALYDPWIAGSNHRHSPRTCVHSSAGLPFNPFTR